MHMRFVLAFALLAGSAVAQWPELRLQRILTGLENPTDIAFSPDGRMWILEQPGRVRLASAGALETTPALRLTNLSAGGERGLLGIAFPPNFNPVGGHFYLNYTDPQGASVISRFRTLTGGCCLVRPETEEVILRIARTRANHNGGGIAFGPDGYLYIGTGDSGGSGDPDNAAQTPSELRGKMLRIDTESGQTPYAVPPTNPFVQRTGYRPEIWAVGLRNPWRYTFDRQTGDLWIADVGQNRAEEINVQPASSTGGENYGWRTMEGLGCFNPREGCNRDGLTLPILEYGRNLGGSVTGGYVYRGTRFPALQGIYLYADFVSGRIWGARRNGETSLLLDSGLNISTFGQDPSGELYLADHNGSIYAIAAGTPQTSVAGIVNAASFVGGLVPGSLVSLFGSGFTTWGGVVRSNTAPFPTELSGVSVLVNGQPVPLYAVARTEAGEQVNFQLPWNLAGSSTATIAVRAYGVTGPAIEVPLSPVQPEIFVVTPTVTGFIVWATGLGPVSSPQTAGEGAPSSPLATVAGVTTVSVNGTPMQVDFAGLAPGSAGLYQINVTAPRSASGDVVLSVGAARSKAFRYSAPAQ